MWLSTSSPSACDIKVMRCPYQGHTLAQPLPNCLCHILKHSWVTSNQCQPWSQPFVRSTPFYLGGFVRRPTPNVTGESPSSTDKLVWMPSQMKNASLDQSHSLLKVVFTWAEVLKCVGWDGMLISSLASVALGSQQICNGLKILHAGVDCYPGVRPTKHISIEFEIRWKFKTL